ncbi:MAG: hypothetical protein ACP5IO_02635 [Elusimicrobiales bacterium]
MRCFKIDEMIERFYKEPSDSVLTSHINQCSYCKKFFDIIYALDKVVFNEEPLNETDEKILSYALKKITVYNPFYYMKKIFISFALASLVLVYLFKPANNLRFMDDFDKKVMEVENDISSFESLSYYSYDFSDYLNLNKEEL